MNQLIAVCKQHLEPTEYETCIRNGNLALLSNKLDEAQDFFNTASLLNPKAARPLLGKAKQLTLKAFFSIATNCFSGFM